MTDFDDDDSFPELLEAEWGNDQVMALFRDLAEGAEVEHVPMHSGAGDRAVTFSEARAASF
ncbi:hypothetical protein Q31b_26720 [Novipirellula aureliae]|uniref:Uncharacterized protein n=1 Tax=Novipirellula aureliae TaxID=2527966 RepID=A0A5C6DV34_9BACT|nr:hypothetical protein [Novipirellula aureliae]TWU41233.1 hypothetical protein Q31b_26720 [Novipirellula aureliae]